MPYAVTKFQDTPNPNALKCIVDHRLSERPRSYFNAEQAQDDPIAAALFAIEGVTNVLINTDWVTVNKRPEADWRAIKAAIERVLREAD